MLLTAATAIPHWCDHRMPFFNDDFIELNNVFSIDYCPQTICWAGIPGAACNLCVRVAAISVGNGIAGISGAASDID